MEEKKIPETAEKAHEKKVPDGTKEKASDTAPQKEEAVKKEKSRRPKRILLLVVALILVVIATNPAAIWFLPDNAKGTLHEVWYRLFGDVGAVTDTLRINWISIFQIAVIILFMAILVNVVRFILEKLTAKEGISGRVKSILSMIDSYIVYAAVLVSLVWCLSAIGINLSTIFASLGIVALIIGFAAESLIADIITGLFLVFEGEFNVGDMIEFNGFRGEVVSIGVRVTTIQDIGQNLKIVNNSDIRDVLNRSKKDSKAVCDIPVPYSADLDRVEKILDEILKKLSSMEEYKGIFAAAPAYKGVQELGASAVILRVSADVPEDKLFDAIRAINREVKLGFDKAGVEIPFQQVVVHKAGD